MDQTDHRLTRIEEALGFTDHAVAELNEALLEAHKRIDLLEQQLRALRARVDAPPEPDDPPSTSPSATPEDHDS